MSSSASVPVPAAVVYGGCSDIGRRREHNEDAWQGGPLGTGTLLLVCDGMGGAMAGEVASKLAVDGFRSILQARIATESPPTDFRSWLDAAAREIDQRIRLAAREPGCTGMGTTLSALWLDGARGGWVQAGDSRIYQFRGGELRQLTRDQSPVGRLRASGQLTEAEARWHPHRHVIDQCLGGMGALVEPDSGALELQPGDVFLLCSDGLSDGLWDRELADGLGAITTGATPDNVAGALVARANATSGADNITALVARVDRIR